LGLPVLQDKAYYFVLVFVNYKVFTNETPSV
jgi:hypothetical protein